MYKQLTHSIISSLLSWGIVFFYNRPSRELLCFTHMAPTYCIYDILFCFPYSIDKIYIFLNIQLLLGFVRLLKVKFKTNLENYVNIKVLKCGLVQYCQVLGQPRAVNLNCLCMNICKRVKSVR